MSGRTTNISGKKNNYPDKKNRSNVLMAWGLAIFSFILYSNSIGNDYNLDDELVTKNHSLTSQGLSGLIKIFSSPYYADASGNVYEYRPMVLASFAIEHQFFADNPKISHFFNALLYSLLIFMLFKLLCLLFSTYCYLLPFAATLLFASHPLHTEVVASIKNRDEILALLFGVSSMLFAVKYIDTDKKKYLFFTILMFLLGLLSKKSIMPFALIIPLSLILFRNPKLSQIVFLTAPLGFVASVTSHFFDINMRLLLFLGINISAVLFYSFNKYKSWGEILNDLSSFKKLFFYKQNNHNLENADNSDKPQIKLFLGTVVILSVFLTLMGIVNNSKFLLSSVLILNVLIYITSAVSYKERLLPVIAFSSMALLTQNGIVSGFMLFAAYFIKNINFKNRIHWICMVLFIIPLLFNFERYIVILFYFLLISFIVLSYQIRKTGLIPKIFSFSLTIVFLVLNSMSGNYENETNFITFTMLILGLSYFKILKFERLAYYLILMIIPLTVITEVFFFKGYNMPLSYMHTVAISEATDIMPASGRLLEFAEMPINKTTPLSIRAGTAFVSMAFYLKLLILPHPLGFYYGYNMLPVLSISNHWALISVLLHLGLFILALLGFKKNKIISFAILYYLICISIFSNIIAPVAGLIAERLVFTASLGFCLALAYFIMKISYRKTDLKLKTLKINSTYIILLLLIVLLYSYKTFSRNSQWKNHLTLFENDMVYLDRSAQAHNLIANALIENLQKEKIAQKRNNMFDKAIDHFNKALSVYPDFYNASYSLGKVYYMSGKTDEALSTFEKTLKIDSTEYMVYMYLGIISEEKNNHEKAISYYNKTIEKAPVFIDAYTNLSALYVKLNMTQKAIETNLSLLKIKPDTYEPILNIGKIYFSAGNLPAALEYFEKAYAINKSDKNLVNALYEINKSLGNMEKANYYKR